LTTRGYRYLRLIDYRYLRLIVRYLRLIDNRYVRLIDRYLRLIDWRRSSGRAATSSPFLPIASPSLTTRAYRYPRLIDYRYLRRIDRYLRLIDFCIVQLRKSCHILAIPSGRVTVVDDPGLQVRTTTSQKFAAVPRRARLRRSFAKKRLGPAYSRLRPINYR